MTWCGALRGCPVITCYHPFIPLLVNILRCVRLHIQRKYKKYYSSKSISWGLLNVRVSSDSSSSSSSSRCKRCSKDDTLFTNRCIDVTGEEQRSENDEERPNQEEDNRQSDCLVRDLRRRLVELNTRQSNIRDNEPSDDHINSIHINIRKFTT